MDDLDHVTKQMQSLDLSSNDCKDGSVPQRQTAKDSPSLKSKDQIDAGDEVEISLSGSDSEDGNDSRAIEAASASVNSREKGRSSKAVNSGADSAAVQNIVYRFDAQVFKGNSKPIKTCCFCKEDGHIKKQCPDLRKPPLRGLPQMTSQFGQLLDYVCKTCRGVYIQLYWYNNNYYYNYVIYRIFSFRHWAPNKRQVQINTGSIRLSFK